MDVLLVSFGSAGDVHPFLALGLALRERSHRVTVATNDAFEDVVRREGLEFVALGQPERKQTLRQGLDLRGPRDWLRLVYRATWRRLGRYLGRRWIKLARLSSVVPHIRPVYELIAARYVPGDTVVVASGTAYGARVAHDKLGVPLATVHLSPAMFRSVFRPPVQPPLVLPGWLPHWSKRAVYWLVDTLVIDRLLGPPINALRKELDLPPVRRLFGEWRHSPQQVIGLFPGWFSQPQPDWPTQTCLTEFPFYDEGSQRVIPAEVKVFLDGGEPPIVFTAGSATRKSRRFFAESVAACRRLGRRGLLLTPFREQVPADLPEDILHCDYLPFGQVLPYAAALVHHGGIGTTAQALAAGIPQLVMPTSHDQPDNASRLRELGVAHVIRPRSYRASTVARELRRLLESREIIGQCRSLARLFSMGNSLEETCWLVEQVGRVAVPVLPRLHHHAARKKRQPHHSNHP